MAKLTVKRAWTERLLPGAAFFSVLWTLIYYLTREMLPPLLSQPLAAPLVWGFVTLRPLAALCEGLVLLGALTGPERRRPFLLLNAAWLPISRLLLGAPALFVEGSAYWALLFACFFHAPGLLRPRARERLASLVALGAACVLLLWALLGIPTALTGRSVLGVAGVSVSVEYTPAPLTTLSLFGVHRNLAAAAYVLGTGLLLHRRAGGRPLWRALWALLLPLSFCMLSLLHSRSCQLAFALLLALPLTRRAARLPRWPQGKAGTAASLCLAAACAALLYAAQGWAGDGLMAATRELREPAAASSAPEAAPLRAALAAKEAGGADPRNALRDALTLTGRTEVWAAGLATLRDEPRAALLGLPEREMMARVNARLTVPRHHMHNLLFQQLMTAGVPGLALYALFLLFLLRRMRPGLLGGTDAAAALTATLAAGLVYGVFEPLLSMNAPLPSLLFAFAAGLLCCDGA